MGDAEVKDQAPAPGLIPEIIPEVCTGCSLRTLEWGNAQLQYCTHCGIKRTRVRGRWYPVEQESE